MYIWASKDAFDHDFSETAVNQKVRLYCKPMHVYSESDRSDSFEDFCPGKICIKMYY